MAAESSYDPIPLLFAPDLFDLVYRIALKIVRDEDLARDCRQGAYEVAIGLVRKGDGPRPGMERGWMCRVTKNHTYAELRRRRGEEQPVPNDDEAPDIPVEDQQSLFEKQQRFERTLEIAEELSDKHPEHVERVLASDGRKEKGEAARDGAERKRRERSRNFLVSAFSAAIAAAIMLIVLRPRPVPTDHHGLDLANDGTLASTSREMARQSCAARDWSACLVHLDEAHHRDPAQFGATEQAEWTAAVGGLRAAAYRACVASDWMSCLERLDEAKKYDPQGEEDPTVRLTRSEAEAHLRGAGAQEPESPSPEWDSKGPWPGQRR